MNIAKDSFIKWIRKDLNELIQDARIALEDYAEGSRDRGLIAACVDKLHKVTGTLRMVQLYGAAQLSEEVEALARAIHEDRINNHKEAVEALMLGIVQLPDYLDRIQAGAQDTPLPIMAILNELRTARNAELLSELNLFGQDLERQLAEVVEMGQPNPELPKLAGKVRLQFHKGLLKWFRDIGAANGLREVLAVSDLMANNAGTGRVRDFFRAVGALSVSLATKSMDTGVTVKQLLGKVDREIKRIIDGGEQALVKEPPLELFKHILYYVAQSNSEDERVVETRNAYDLSSLSLAGIGRTQQSGGLNAELFESVAEALSDDLTKIKDELDLFIRTGGNDTQRLEQVREPLAKLAGTLGMLGQNEMRDRLKAEVDKVNTWIGGGEAPTEDELMSVASEILAVEADLEQTSFADGFSRKPEEKESKPKVDKDFNKLLETALKEAAIDMAHIKEAISSYFSNGDTSLLQNIKQRFKTVQGALKMMQLEEPAEMLSNVAAYVENRLGQGGAPPAASEAAALADVISSIEYFMESVSDDVGKGEDILSYTRGAMDRLDAVEVAPAEEVPQQQQSSEIVSNEPAKPYEPEVITELELFDSEEEDSEILDIFLEEAHEEWEVIQELVPRWLSNFDDKESLTRFRRSFHTLKGSGRLVGAEVVGEFAWSIENLLNRIIDGTVKVSDAFTELMHDVLRVLPKLIECESNKQKPDFDYQSIMERAFAIAEGREVEVSSAAAEPAAQKQPPSISLQPAPTADSVPVDTLSINEEVLYQDTIQAPSELGQESIEIPALDLPEEAPTLSLEETPESSNQSDGDIGFELDFDYDEPEAAIDDPTVPLLAEEEQPTAAPTSGFNFVPEAPEVTMARMKGEADISRSSEIKALEDSLEDPFGDTEPVDDDMLPAPPIELDQVLKEIFETESAGHLQTLEEYLADCNPQTGCIVTTQVTRALHTLHGSADMAGVVPIARVSKANEKYFDTLLEHKRIAKGEDIELLRATVGITRAVLGVINKHGAKLPDWQEHVTRIDQKHAAVEAEVAASSDAVEPDSGSYSMIDPEGLIEDTKIYPETEMLQEQQPASNNSLDLGLELKHDESISLDILPDLSEEKLEEDPIDSLFDLKVDIPTELRDIGSDIPEISLEEIADSRPDGMSSGFLMDDLQGVDAEEISLDVLPGSSLDEIPDQPLYGETVTEQPSLELSSQPQSESSALEAIEGEDEELIEIFLEEAQELNEGLEAELVKLQQNYQSKESLAELKRLLHTMKGASRLAGVMQIGDMSHAFESLLIAIDRGSVTLDDKLFPLVRRVGDHLMSQVDSLASSGRVPPGRELVTLLEAAQRGEFSGQEALEEIKGIAQQQDQSAEQPQELESILVESDDDGEPLPVLDQSDSIQLDLQAFEPSRLSDTELTTESQLVDDSNAETSSRLIDSNAEASSRLIDSDSNDAPPSESASRPFVKRSRDVIRVRSDQLDRMVNNAGEISIYRTRLEQQNGEMAFSLNELDQTVARLRQQLRVMEIETEAQMLYRYEKDKEAGAQFNEEKDKDFDPLEMDRFSTIQQVSRSLAETINDLVSIRDMMDERNRETETLLLQQSRVTNDLQDGLLRTRMVSFQQVVARLQRLVRQTAQTENKQAELTVEGAGGEVDRSILDRIVAPLEHILRNAVSHGIETPEQRASAGKSETGRIVLVLRREGRDVVLTISDDGGGINYAAVRKRAVERGLINSEADIADEDLVQFVLEPGFSTATTVTQVSGRGVGMDVVSSEVKQLGGTLDMQSTPGTGTTFTVRLPFTLALAEALLVNVSEDVFAIPHTSIEGVTRISRQELESCYKGEQDHIVYAGNKYRVRYLGEMLEFVKKGSDYLADLQNRWFPLLLVKHGEHRVAVHVDQMVGSRQIVVKSVGMQLSTVRWVTGGTILGDGRVALILDVNALVRLSDIHHKRMAKAGKQPDKPKAVEPPPVEEVEQKKVVTVMVVDDSITVRKVTTRLLKRHNIEAVTAKDGVDAVAQLQDITPDVMLVDIEMPRMDGYELTRHVRNTETLKDVPIIMITSRSGDKHRQRAMELGVNIYLGKPYQEAELLDNIYSLLTEKVTS